MRILHTMVRVGDLRNRSRLFEVLGMKDMRQKDYPEGNLRSPLSVTRTRSRRSIGIPTIGTPGNMIGQWLWAYRGGSGHAYQACAEK